MEKHLHPFDDSVKEALKGHQLKPTDKARKAFLEEASGIIPPKKGWNQWYLLPILLVLIGSITAVFFALPDADQVTAPTSEIIPNNNINSNSLSLSTVETTTTKSTESTESSKSINPQTPKSINPQTPKSLNPQTPISINPQTPISLNPQTPISLNPQTPISLNPQTPISLNPQIAQSPDTLALSEPPVPHPDVSTDTLPGKTDEPLDTTPQVPVTRQPWEIAGAINYTPELMFNTLEGNKLINNFGLDVILYHGLVSLRTGAGISVSQGITTNSVEYNDFLGTYSKLDSITFDFNEQLNNFEPTLYMSDEKVWDSIGKEDSTDIIKRYTYLQVPLVLGFDFWQKGKISVGVRIGTIMSVMLKSNQLTGPYDPGENLVIGVNQLTPSRVNLNWQAMAGFSASAVLSKRITIELEPQARYYYGSIYEKSGNADKPWSLGLRIALVNKF